MSAIADVPTELPEFEFVSKLIDIDEMKERHGWPEGDDRIHYPTILNASRHLSDPIAEYYLYASPHDHEPGCGVGLWTADDVSGPWTFEGRVIARSQATPSVIYDGRKERVVVYTHGPNGTNNVFDSADGVEFTERGEMGLEPSAQGYGQVFEYPFPERGTRYCGLFWIGFCPPDCGYDRHSPYTGLYVSEDGYDGWECVDRDFYPPANAFTGNANAPAIANNPHFGHIGDSRYVLFHHDGGEIWAYRVDERLEPITYAGIVFEPGQLPDSLQYDGLTSPILVYDREGELHLIVGAKRGDGRGDILLARAK